MATDAVIEILDSLPADAANSLERCGKAIDAANGRGVLLIVEMGKLLSEAHSILARQKSGTFCGWVSSRCGMSRMTANNYMKVAARFSDDKCKSLLHYFTAEALYYLARSETPNGAIGDALKMAKSGERVGISAAREIVDEYTVDEVLPDVVDDEQQWSPSSCMVALRSEVARWAKLCPAKETKELSRTLRELADQVDGGNWNEC